MIKLGPIRPLRPVKMLNGVVAQADDALINKFNGVDRNIQLPPIPGLPNSPKELPDTGIACEMAIKTDAIADLAIHRRTAGVTLWTVLRDVEMGHPPSLP